jgi:hypothetical protein
MLEAPHVVALPAVQRHRNRGKPLQHDLGIHAEGSVTFTGKGVGGGAHGWNFLSNTEVARELR